MMLSFECGGEVLLEELTHWGWALRFDSQVQLPVFLHFLIVQAVLPPAMLNCNLCTQRSK